MSDPHFLSAPAVADRLGIDHDKVLTFIRDGSLPAIDVSLAPGKGRPRYRIDLIDLEQFLADRRVAKPRGKSKRRRKTAKHIVKYL